MALQTVTALRAIGKPVHGVALVSNQPFSPRYDLNRASGIITRKGHPLEGCSIKDVVLICPTAKGGVAGGWAFIDLKARGLAPRALLFDVANPVMVQGCAGADIPIMDSFDEPVTSIFRTGDQLEVDPTHYLVRIER